MKKGQKIILLFVALLFPACIFIFLKIFGRNEFAVEPLFQKETPALPAPCGTATAPYLVPSDKRSDYMRPHDSLAIVFLTKDSIGSSSTRKTFAQLKEEYEKDPVSITMRWPAKDEFDSTFHCTFAMKKPQDIALIDNHGVIRGQYKSSDRDEIDRLKTEITIILKRY
jgi:hypothetical protein